MPHLVATRHSDVYMIQDGSHPNKGGPRRSTSPEFEGGGQNAGGSVKERAVIDGQEPAGGELHRGRIPDIQDAETGPDGDRLTPGNAAVIGQHAAYFEWEVAEAVGAEQAPVRQLQQVRRAADNPGICPPASGHGARFGDGAAEK